jgi:hypothetical protein
MLHRAALRFLLPCLLAVAACGDGDVTLASQWLDRRIEVDGREDEWSGALTYLDDVKIGVGARNDAARLYLCLVLRDRALQAQILRRGLIVWVDPAGGMQKRLGIRFPLDRVSAGAAAAEGAASEAGRASEVGAAAGTSFEILSDGGYDATPVRREDSRGVRVALNSASSKLVYELEIPLVPGANPSAVAIGAAPGSRIGIGLETAGTIAAERAPRRPTRPRGGRGPDVPNDFPPLQPGAAWPATSDQPPGRRTSVKRLEVWAILQLATDPAAPR